MRPPFYIRRNPLGITLLKEVNKRTRSTGQQPSEKLSGINLGTTVLHIPMNFTSQLQVLDVSVNRPFKHYIRQLLAPFEIVMGILEERGFSPFAKQSGHKKNSNS